MGSDADIVLLQTGIEKTIRAADLHETDYTPWEGHVVTAWPTTTILRGKVVAVTFIFTKCTNTCPVLTPMMSFVQDRLGADFGSKIAFVSITVDPERDSPQVLREYGEAFGANFVGWSFLTGSPSDIRDVTRRYGVFAAKADNGNVDHTFLTSIIDPRGILRVQYLGVRFDPEDFRLDLLSLMNE